MKYTIALMLIVVILSSIVTIGDVDLLSVLDYESMVRNISKGISSTTGLKDIAKDLTSLGDATNFVANLPYK